VLGLKFRCLMAGDVGWLTELENDPEVAKYAIFVYPLTEHETEEFLKKDLETDKVKHIVAEWDGEPAGVLSLWFMGEGRRDRHVAWLGLSVRRKHWGKGVGEGLIKEAIKLAKESACRRLMLGTTVGNERAIRLYTKCGFKNEAYEDEEVYVDGAWRRNFIMGLELAACEPKLDTSSLYPKPSANSSSKDIQVRQLMNRDLDELNRLQNCPESVKSSHRIPPIKKEETRKWYEKLDSREGQCCFACFRNDSILGYLHFRASQLPFPCLKFEEIVVDVKRDSGVAAETLISAIKGFKERYSYRKVFAYVPETSMSITSALDSHGFKKTGAMKDYYLIGGYYVDMAVYEYP
jgi:RimJ/RimL family protein N-acetyltransferase